MTNLNLDLIKSEITKLPKLKELLEIFASRQRGRQDTRYRRLSRMFFLTHNVIMTRDEFTKIFDLFQKAGVGKIIQGINRSDIKFVWSYNLTSVACAVLGVPDPRPLKDKNGNHKAEVSVRPQVVTKPALPRLVTTTRVPQVSPNNIKEEITKKVNQIVKIRRNGYEFEVNLDNMNPNSCKFVSEIIKLATN